MEWQLKWKQGCAGSWSVDVKTPTTTWFLDLDDRRLLIESYGGTYTCLSITVEDLQNMLDIVNREVII